MKRLVAHLCITVLAATPQSQAAFPVFRLADTAGKTWSQADVKTAKAVVFVFLGTQCPINNAYLPRLNELHAKYARDSVVLLGVNANEHDRAEDVRKHAKEFRLAFPVLRDAEQLLAEKLGARRTPEAFVLDAEGTVRYQGRIDDQFGIGYQKPAATEHHLDDAIERVLAGKEVAHSKTDVAGCYITRTPRPKGDATVTYSRDVARIMRDRCVECHRPGQIGPMPLRTYDDIAPWAAMIKEVVEEKRMPPWHADPRFGKFHNDRSLSDDERATLVSWIDQGCPKGDATDLPPSRAYPGGWTIGEPDSVFEMPRSYRVPAKAPKRGIPYQYFVVPTRFEEDKWIQAVEAKPGNRAVVHHIIVYIMLERKRPGIGIDGIGQDLLVAYAPGDFGAIYPAESAKKLPKGASLVFQMHYTPNGVEQSDRSSVGIVFAKKPPKYEVATRAIAQRLLFIWPERDNQRAFAASTFKEDAVIWNLMPHMHLRGKSFKYDAVYPDGKRETLLSVPRYDFAWQASYRLRDPLHLPAGSRIECTAHFDNSKNNPSNPDPSKMVHWGDQTWEEMMIGFVDYSAKGRPQRDAP